MALKEIRQYNIACDKKDCDRMLVDWPADRAMNEGRREEVMAVIDRLDEMAYL